MPIAFSQSLTSHPVFIRIQPVRICLGTPSVLIEGLCCIPCGEVTAVAVCNWFLRRSRFRPTKPLTGNAILIGVKRVRVCFWSSSLFIERLRLWP